MIKLADKLSQYWKTNQALPVLWYEYVPEGNDYPVARFEMTGFGRDYASSGFALDKYQVEFNVYDLGAGEAFDKGQQALTHIGSFGGDDIVNVKTAPETFATPVEAGEKTVWGFKFVAEFTVIHEGE